MSIFMAPWMAIPASARPSGAPCRCISISSTCSPCCSSCLASVRTDPRDRAGGPRRQPKLNRRSRLLDGFAKYYTDNGACAESPHPCRPTGHPGRTKGRIDVEFRPELCPHSRRSDRSRGRLRYGPARPHDPRLQLHGWRRRTHRRGRLADLSDGRRYECLRSHRGLDTVWPDAVRLPVEVAGDASTAGLRVLHELPDRAYSGLDSAALVLRLCSCVRTVPRDNLHGLHGDLDHEGVLHYGRRFWSAKPLWLHDQP